MRILFINLKYEKTERGEDLYPGGFVTGINFSLKDMYGSITEGTCKGRAYVTPGELILNRHLTVSVLVAAKRFYKVCRALFNSRWVL